MSDLVSIIIPTFNRGPLLGQTLTSVVNQTYENWECIIIDDGSTDDTVLVVAPFLTDPRFQFHRRPDNRPKGANACRNYGFEISKGQLVIWFDSDDLMLPEKLQKQVSAIQVGELDFCIAGYENFSDPPQAHSEPKVAHDPTLQINAGNYITGKIFWVTNDLMGRREMFVGKRFNETLRSGQEYNFFISVLSAGHFTGVFLDETLSMRRVHAGSIQQLQKGDNLQRLQNKFAVYWTSYIDFHEQLDRESIMFLLQKSALFYHKLALNGSRPMRLRTFISLAARHLPLVKIYMTGVIIYLAMVTSKGDIAGSRMIKKLIQ